MAKLTAQGGLRLTLSGDRASLWPGSRDQIPSTIGAGKRILERPVGIRRSSRRGVVSRDAARVSALGRKSRSFRADECMNGDGKDVEEGDDDDEEEEDQFKGDEFSCFRGLVLDISYRPVNVVCWKRAICLEFMDKADVLEYYDQTVSSPQGSFYIPAVLQIPHLLQVVKRRRVKKNLSRKNIFYRDSFICQYCSSRQNLTIDHVIPISRGGEWKWENLVTACARCNSRKGQKTLEETNMKLLKIPKAPKEYDILAIPLTSAAIRMLKMRNGEGDDEWLSIYVEDCLSSATSYTNFNPLPTPMQSSIPQPSLNLTAKSSPFNQNLAIPAKARTKRRRITITPRNLSLGTFSSFHLPPSDPPLLHQSYWLAESQLILPKKEVEEVNTPPPPPPPPLEKVVEEKEGGSVVQPRRCTHCLSQKTPQWRAGPLGPKTLCNACGVRFKSGRLLPEYRPAKSPTFVSYKHSNSHKKVMMMRMALMSSNAK
ncbi:hypothetical protein Cni_G08167 [Canna indica]|uniref:GATA-type domain-containing protein n=1 Tax=Canna indica TaxID=4628 RepID=A0AAQ3K5C4_9LILI|nr:hypothetical protein Cni_G08167 [Canna indica]